MCVFSCVYILNVILCVLLYRIDVFGIKWFVYCTHVPLSDWLYKCVCVCVCLCVSVCAHAFVHACICACT